MSKADTHRRVRAALDKVDLLQKEKIMPITLSGGEQQRVSVARALINDPALILADEPSGNLDSKTAKELHQLFFDLRDKFQQTFVIVTHNEDLAKMADRTLVMKDGMIIERGTHEDLLRIPGLYRKMWDAQMGEIINEILPIPA